MKRTVTKATRRRFKIFGIITIALFSLWRLTFLIHFAPDPNLAWGVSFSPEQAEYLGLDSRQAYRAILDELNIKHLRLSAYWDRIEKRPGQFDFSELDWQMDEASRHHAQVVLAIGRRLPRWPECHAPAWSAQLDEAAIQAHILRLDQRMIERYRNHPALSLWQVENEPFLTIFGKCPPIARDFVVNEITLVKTLDPHRKVMVVDSGELSTWLRSAHLADILGSTMYRVVWHPWFGYVAHEHTIPMAFYRLKAWLVRKPLQDIYIAELQAEPWAPDGLTNTTIDEQIAIMDPQFFSRTIQFAGSSGFPRIYLWGAEWWYFMKLQGHPEYWEMVKRLD